MKRLHIIALLVVLLLAAGCGGMQEASSPGLAPQEPEMAMEEEMVSEDAQKGLGSAVEGVSERMIIYNGSLDLVVKDTVATQEEIATLMGNLDGYVLSSESFRYDEGLLRINMTLRVPAESFQQAMAQLREMALEVTRDAISSQDVTQEYVDLESRLRALEAKEARLEELMDEAEDTEAVLAVYEELSATQQEIEQVKGRMQYLERSASLATITVSLTPDELSQPVEVAGWRPQGTLKRAVEALIRTGQFLVNALIWIIIYVAPVLLVVGLVIFAVVKVFIFIIRRLRGGKKRKPAESPQE
ncbi:MAG: DUF4349 domain-containing protein [Anaerolineae bacterium]